MSLMIRKVMYVSACVMPYMYIVDTGAFIRWLQCVNASVDMRGGGGGRVWGCHSDSLSSGSASATAGSCPGLRWLNRVMQDHEAHASDIN